MYYFIIRVRVGGWELVQFFIYTLRKNILEFCHCQNNYQRNF